MKLLFEWIKCDENGIFENCGISFTDDYCITYDSSSLILSIKKKQSCIPKSFYALDGSNIVQQVTCVLGKNGSGKTSLLKHICKTDLLRMEKPEAYPFWNTIQVFEFDGKINIYHNQGNISVECDEPFNIWNVTDHKTVNETLEDGCYAHLTKIFVSNDYTVALNSNFTNKGYQSHLAFTPYDISVLQSGFFDLITKQSDSILILRNLLYKFNKYLQKHINQQFFQNILYVLLWKTLVKVDRRDRFKYFKNVKVTFQSIRESDAYLSPYRIYSLITGRFGLDNIINRSINKEEIEEFAFRNGIEFDYDLLRICAVHEWVVKTLHIESNAVYSNLRINLITEILLSLIDFGVAICTLKSYDLKDLLEILENKNLNETTNFNENQRKIKQNELQYFKQANESIEKLKDIIPNVERESNFLLDSNPQFVEYIYNEVKSRNSFVLKYFWLSYACSAGERAFLNILSALNSIIYFRYLSNSAVNGTNKQIILILDEPDLYCHPEWQRKMLHEIIESLELLYRDYSFHIIFSTHSPLFLSDVPRENTVVLDRKENGICVADGTGKQTFGANVFDLYNNSFLLDSFIGEFAQQKIGDIIKKISGWYSCNIKAPNNELHETEAIIDLIGEPILKNKLKSILRQLQERA